MFSWNDASCSKLCPFLFLTFWHWVKEEYYMATSVLQHIQRVKITILRYSDLFSKKELQAVL